MGVDIDMTVGAGIHVSKEQIDKWLGVADPDEAGSWDCVEGLLSTYRGISFSWAGNAWVGTDHGFVFWSDGSTKSFDMGREAQSGVYEPSPTKVPLADRNSLSEISVAITGEVLPIKPYVVVTVS